MAERELGLTNLPIFLLHLIFWDRRALTRPTLQRAILQFVADLVCSSRSFILYVLMEIIIFLDFHF